MRIKYLLLFILIAANSIIAQSTENNPKKTSIKWKNVENAIGYKLEIRPDKEKEMQINSTENEVFLDLKPGKYEYRVGALNKFKKVKHWSKWSSLEVIYSQPPIVEENLKYTFTIPEKKQDIVVKGKYFLEDIEVELESSNGIVPINEIKRVSESEIKFSVNLETFTSPDSFRLTLRNPLNKSTSVDSFVLLQEKPKSAEPNIAETKDTKPDDPTKIDKDNSVAKETREGTDTTTEVTKGEPKKSYFAEVFPPLWRSSLIPGWGQYYKGEKTKAYIFGGSVVFFLSSVFFFESYKQYSLSRSDQFSNLLFLLPGDRNLLPAAIYLRSQSIESRNNAQEEVNKQEAVVGVATAIYLYNVVDILINRKSSDKIINAPEKTSGLFFNMGNQGRGSFQFGFSYRF
ncbi:MAG TPA: DUF5683 domain-containing protein [Leptospiraceae bacterium]|nr:DUF5683 domain-containing protein [Leptospiraceae bacterium]HMW05951.1 DUF5683 domain-containing protein [Leptospiraceae bacterium]HMX32117.1 DUF5683 domain-containing protein [Leptospiraceae bacterium]HMY32305.1 DUF5683 domain-containing protein [Leptospiraceae bacterium]HMZ62493.1 DUF5683 domain-containing protein [Leptospiraceae bacterium]